MASRRASSYRRSPASGAERSLGVRGDRLMGPSLAPCASEGRCGIGIVDRPYWGLQ
jgi:hypothetical protein